MNKLSVSIHFTLYKALNNYGKYSETFSNYNFLPMVLDFEKLR